MIVDKSFDSNALCRAVERAWENSEFGDLLVVPTAKTGKNGIKLRNGKSVHKVLDMDALAKELVAGLAVEF